MYNSYSATSWSLYLTDDDNNVAVKLDFSIDPLCCAFYCPYLIFDKFIYSSWLFSEATFQTGHKGQSYQPAFKLQE